MEPRPAQARRRLDHHLLRRRPRLRLDQGPEPGQEPRDPPADRLQGRRRATVRRRQTRAPRGDRADPGHAEAGDHARSTTPSARSRRPIGCPSAQRDDLNNSALIQRQVGSRMNNRDDGLDQKIRQLLDDLGNFKIANPDAQQQLQDMLQRLGRVRDQAGRDRGWPRGFRVLLHQGSENGQAPRRRGQSWRRTRASPSRSGRIYRIPKLGRDHGGRRQRCVGCLIHAGDPERAKSVDFGPAYYLFERASISFPPQTPRQRPLPMSTSPARASSV